ncbi:tetratricopeptide repeat protein [Cyanobacteria bacterium FACHB-63]|nr:tetratricopeptide repeat protein [Cyanobacteria bacterium FACHB-63]
MAKYKERYALLAFLTIEVLWEIANEQRVLIADKERNPGIDEERPCRSDCIVEFNPSDGCLIVTGLNAWRDLALEIYNKYRKTHADTITNLKRISQTRGRDRKKQEDRLGEYIKDALDALREVGFLEYQSENKEGHSFRISKLFDQPITSWHEEVSQQFQRKEQEIKETGAASRNKESGGEIAHPDLSLPYSGAITFLGRDTLMRDLHEILNPEQRSAQVAPSGDSEQVVASRKNRWVVLKGMGGVGKSELAAQYALQYQSHYSSRILWISARLNEAEDFEGSTEEYIASQIIEFAKVRLNLPVSNNSQDNFAHLVQRCWDLWNVNEAPNLVIFDDLTDEVFSKIVKKLMPNNRPRFRVIITSRHHLGASNRHIEVPALDDDNAFKLLEINITEGTGESDPRLEGEENKRLGFEIAVEVMGGLPLGIELVGRYLGRRPTFSLSQMLERIASEKLKDREYLNHRFPDMTYEHKGIWAAISLSWKLLGDDAKELSLRLGLCDSAPIPWDMIVRSYPDNIDLYDLEDVRDFELVDSSLLKRISNQFSGVFRVHQIIQEFFQGQLEEEEHALSASDLKKDFCRAIASCVQGVQQTLMTQCEIDEVSPIIPHAIQGVTSYARQGNIDHITRISFVIVHFYESQGSYLVAIAYAEQSLIRLQQLSASDLDANISAIRNFLAAHYQLRGRYEEAESLFRQLLQSYLTTSDKDNFAIAGACSNLARLYQELGRYEEAEPLFLQALQAYSTTPDEELPAVAALTRNELARLYKAQGRYEEAELLFLQALQALQALQTHSTTLDEAGGSNFVASFVANSRSGLASIYQELGRYGEAEPLFLQALEAYIATSSEEHYNIALTCHKLARLYQELGRYGEAESFFLQALQAYSTTPEEERLNIIGVCNNLALLYRDQRRYKEAETIFKQALETVLTISDEELSAIVSVRTNLALLYRTQGRYEEAESLFRQVLQLPLAILDTDHAISPLILNNLASLYQAQGRYEEAEPLFRQALEAYPHLDENHLHIVDARTNLAYLYQAQGRYEEAESLFEPVLKSNLTTLDPNHPHVAKARNHLALLYQAQGRYQEMESLFEQAFEAILKQIEAQNSNTIIH